jgi:hypothetical protein
MRSREQKGRRIRGEERLKKEMPLPHFQGDYLVVHLPGMYTSLMLFRKVYDYA